jgi:hypothetical protein
VPENVFLMKIDKNIAISESGLIFNPVNGESFSVNPVGLEIIRMIREETPVDEICRVILERFTVDASSFDKDFHDFVSRLKQHGLIAEESHEAKA